MVFQPIKILKRSKSERDITRTSHEELSHENRSLSESSVDINVVNDSGSEFEEDRADGLLTGLERKIDKLNDVFRDQCRLLTEIKEDIRESKTLIEKSEQAQNQFIAEFFKQALSQNSITNKEMESVSVSLEFNSRARSLLDAIETSQGSKLDRELRAALVDCLQSEELKERMVSATAASMRDLLGDNFPREMSRLYVPILQRAHRRLTRQLTRTIDDAFLELERNSEHLTNSMCRASRCLRRALQRHQGLAEVSRGGQGHSYLQYIIEETLQKEIQQWRRFAVEALTGVESNEEPDLTAQEATPPVDYLDSPPQPADPGHSIIDQLMTTAEINKKIQDGDLNAAFERALSAADLSLVMAACRAADPSQVFIPCRLEQSTLLSLAQQLPTDMVHDTQLKCRYLEEALINLDPKHPVTSKHLPLVVGEIRKNLTGFLTKYPSHVACRRITMIIMAGDNLLK